MSWRWRVGVVGSWVGRGGGGGHKENVLSLPPLRSITQSWSLHRAGRLATWQPSSPPSPGNETCDRNQPASSRHPPPIPSPFPSPSPPCSVPLPSLLLLLPRFSSIHLLATNALTLGRTCEFTRGERTSTGGNWYIHRQKKKRKGRTINKKGE